MSFMPAYRAGNPGLWGPAAWTPLDLGASLLAWWDAERPDLITRGGGGEVSSWRDIVRGADLAQPAPAAQPIYNPTAFGGRPGITPDGVDDFLELAGSPSWLPAGSAASEDWYAYDQTALIADASNRMLGAWGATANSNSRSAYRVMTGGANRFGASVNASQFNTLADFSGRHIVRLITTATGFTPEIDGLAPAETASVPATIATRIRMFASANSTATSFGQGVLSARIITGALTVAQADQLRAFLSRRSDPDVAAWAAAVVVNGGTVSTQRMDLINALVSAWKAAGVWALIDDAWLLVAENQPQALTSLKQKRLAVAVNAPGFTVDRGVAFNGTNNYIDTGFICATHAVAMTGTNMHIAVYERSNTAHGGTAAGGFNFSSQGLSIAPRLNTNLLQLVLNSQAVGPGGDVVSDSRGLSVGSRNGTLAADVLGYRNGVPVVPQTPGTLTNNLTTQKTLIGAQMNNVPVPISFRAATEGFVSVGAAIPAGQQPAFYNALQAFMTAVGANV